LSGCTAVLGIHSAELDDSVGGLGTGTSTGSGIITGGTQTKHCTTVVAAGCVDCLREKCPTAINECLSESSCRVALDGYGKCLPETCVDEMKCAESLGMDYPAVGLCMVTPSMCSSSCGKGIVDRCDLYCGCMKSACPTYGGALIGTTYESCMAACSQFTERDKNCRWNHCEFASVSAEAAARHCPHAIPTNQMDDVCNGAPPIKPNTCLVGSEPGFPCHTKDECCHNDCPADQICR